MPFGGVRGIVRSRLCRRGGRNGLEGGWWWGVGVLVLEEMMDVFLWEEGI